METAMKGCTTCAFGIVLVNQSISIIVCDRFDWTMHGELKSSTCHQEVLT